MIIEYQKQNSYNSNNTQYTFILSGLSGSGKYVFPGQRPEVYPFQSIFPGKGGKFKRIGALESACTMLNGMIIESIAGSKKLTKEEECVSQPKLFSPSSLGLPEPFGKLEKKF